MHLLPHSFVLPFFQILLKYTEVCGFNKKREYSRDVNVFPRECRGKRFQLIIQIKIRKCVFL